MNTANNCSISSNQWIWYNTWYDSVSPCTPVQLFQTSPWPATLEMKLLRCQPFEYIQADLATTIFGYLDTMWVQFSVYRDSKALKSCITMESSRKAILWTGLLVDILAELLLLRVQLFQALLVLLVATTLEVEVCAFLSEERLSPPWTDYLKALWVMKTTGLKLVGFLSLKFRECQSASVMEWIDESSVRLFFLNPRVFLLHPCHYHVGFFVILTVTQKGATSNLRNGSSSSSSSSQQGEKRKACLFHTFTTNKPKSGACQITLNMFLCKKIFPKHSAVLLQLLDLMSHSFLLQLLHMANDSQFATSPATCQSNNMYIMSP